MQKIWDLDRFNISVKCKIDADNTIVMQTYNFFYRIYYIQNLQEVMEGEK